jgi:hypothetical protein
MLKLFAEAQTTGAIACRETCQSQGVCLLLENLVPDSKYYYINIICVMHTMQRSSCTLVIMLDEDSAGVVVAA